MSTRRLKKGPCLAEPDKYKWIVGKGCFTKSSVHRASPRRTSPVEKKIRKLKAECLAEPDKYKWIVGKGCFEKTASRRASPVRKSTSSRRASPAEKKIRKLKAECVAEPDKYEWIIGKGCFEKRVNKHHRGCTETVDPITLEPLGDDVIRIETAPLRDGKPGPVHCFDAASFTRYINLNIGAHPNITNPLTGAVMPRVQLDAIMRRLNIEIPNQPNQPNRASDFTRRQLDGINHMTDEQVRLEFRQLYDRTERILAERVSAGLDAGTRAFYTRMLAWFNGMFNEGTVRAAYTNLNSFVDNYFGRR